MIICIVGPTAVGKTKMSVELAKIKEDEKENIPHHLFDFKSINQDYTVFDYQKDARREIQEITKRGKTPILVGGTGLYIKACLYDYQFEKETKKGDYSNYSNEELYKELLKIDGNTNIHINNRKRVERALDYFYEHKIPMSSKGVTDKLLYNVIFVGLTTDRQILYDRINKRVDKMVESGLIEEANKIYNMGIRTKAVMTPIGYKELFPYFEGEKELNVCLDLIKQNSRKYAKRQYTWFNNQMNVQWFNVDFNHFDKTIYNVIDYIKKASE